MLCCDTTSSVVNVEQQLEEGGGTSEKIRTIKTISGARSQFEQILLVESSCLDRLNPCAFRKWLKEFRYLALDNFQTQSIIGLATDSQEHSVSSAGTKLQRY